MLPERKIFSVLLESLLRKEGLGEERKTLSDIFELNKILTDEEWLEKSKNFEAIITEIQKRVHRKTTQQNLKILKNL